MIRRAHVAIPGLPTPPGFRRVAGAWVPEPMRMRGRLGFGGGAARRQGGGIRALGGPAPYLSITTQPASTATDGIPFTPQPVIQLRDGNGNALALADVTVTASKATGAGTLGGTLTAVTNASGVATFANLEIVSEGAHTLNFAATGYTAVVSGTVTVGAAAAYDGPIDYTGITFEHPEDNDALTLTHGLIETFERYALGSIEPITRLASCNNGTTGDVAFGYRPLPLISLATDPDACDPDNNITADGGVPRHWIVAGLNGSGRALRTYIPSSSGSQTGADMYWPCHMVGSRYWTPPASRMATVCQFRVVISVGGTPGSPNGGCKFFILRWDNEGHADGRIQWGADRTGPKFSCALGDNPGNTINRTQADVAANAWSSLNDGAEHYITCLFLPNTTRDYVNTGGDTSANETWAPTVGSSRDGRLAMWIDLDKVIDYSQAAFDASELGGTRWCRQGDVDMIPPYYDTAQLELMSTHNELALTQFSYTHDDLRVFALSEAAALAVDSE